MSTLKCCLWYHSSALSFVFYVLVVDLVLINLYLMLLLVKVGMYWVCSWLGIVKKLNNWQKIYMWLWSLTRRWRNDLCIYGRKCDNNKILLQPVLITGCDSRLLRVRAEIVNTCSYQHIEGSGVTTILQCW